MRSTKQQILKKKSATSINNLNNISNNNNDKKNETKNTSDNEKQDIKLNFLEPTIPGFQPFKRNIALEHSNKYFLIKAAQTKNFNHYLEKINENLNQSFLTKLNSKWKFFGSHNIVLKKRFFHKIKGKKPLFINKVRFPSFFYETADMLLKPSRRYGKKFILIRDRENFDVAKNFVVIRITANNTVITFTDKTGNVIFKTTAGKINLKSSKKTYKHTFHLVLTDFFNYLKRRRFKTYLHFKVSFPKFLQKRVIKQRLGFYLRQKNNLVETIRKLPFNGCRAPKVKRKKRQGLRIFRPKI